MTASDNDLQDAVTGADAAVRRLPDGTVKQRGPLTGTEVWTVPGRGNRPLAPVRPAPAPITPADRDRLCAFCAGRHAETTPEKARLVGPDFRRIDRVPASALDDTVAEFRRFGNLFEIVSAEYWRRNHGFHVSDDVVRWAHDYLADPAGRAHVERIASIRAAATGAPVDLEQAASDLLGGSHDVIVARRHVRDDARHDDELVSSGALTPDEHAAYMSFTVDALGEIAASQPHAVSVIVFQNWLRPAGASFEHLHKQLVAVDEHGRQTDRELALLREDPMLYQHAVVDMAVAQDLVVAACDGAVAVAGVGHRYPSFEVYSTAAVSSPVDHSPAERRAVSDLVHALHAATGVHVPTNEEWHQQPLDVTTPMPWRIVLKWRVSTPAGFEGVTKIYVNTIDPWELRRRAVEALHRLRDAGAIASGIRIGGECTAEDARLHYADASTPARLTNAS